MSRTTFSGPVASQNGFVSVAATSGKALTITAPAALSADTTLVFPNGAGSNGQVLTTNGTGTLTWTTNGAGTVTSVAGTGTVNGLTLTGTVTSSGSLTLGGTLTLAVAPAIGSTTANTGAFTTLKASGKAELTASTNVLVIPTSDPGVANALWLDGATIKVSAGA